MHRYPDLYHYLIHTTSFKTAEEMRNYKSLNAYKYFIDGWVLDVHWKVYGDIFLLVGKVQHSYTVSQKPLKPWVAIRKSGIVECGHCTCMAGLAESCSHVAAILYWLETAVRIHEQTSSTSRPNAWLPQSMPSACPTVPYLTLEELESMATQRKPSETSQACSWNDTMKLKPSSNELEDLYTVLSQAKNQKPALLSLLPCYNENFSKSTENLPQPLQDLYDPSHLTSDYLELINAVNPICKEPLTPLQVSHTEELTRGQAGNKLWFKYRAGRITASKLFQVC